VAPTHQLEDPDLETAMEARAVAEDPVEEEDVDPKEAPEEVPSGALGTPEGEIPLPPDLVAEEEARPEELVPERRRYLTTYFGKASSNPLMPGSLVVAGGVAGSLLATSAGASRDVVVGHTLLATLLALAFIEHLFLALPMRDAVLFRWALGSDAERRGDLETPALAPDAHVGRAERHTERVDRAGPVDPTAAVGVPCTPHGLLVDGGVDGRGHDGR
jgi:hypothetical protein